MDRDALTANGLATSQSRHCYRHAAISPLLLAVAALRLWLLKKSQGETRKRQRLQQ
jgi:hypothetical protein